MSKETLLQDAIKVLSEATNLDKSERSNDALLKYTLGVEKLVEYMRSLPSDDPRKSPFAEKVAQYLNRAEELKLQVRHTVDILEQRRIAADSVGHSYESVFSKCLNDKLTAVYVQDAYIIAHHQILNFVRFCEMLVRLAKNINLITLKTSTDAKSNDSAFKELENSLKVHDVRLEVRFEANLHDREIKFNNGWIVKIGRGLDYFKNPGKYALGACDMNLRKCHETTMNKSVEPNKELNEFKQALFVEAERLVTKEFPRRVLHFESLLQSSRFSYERISEIMPKDDLNIPIPDIDSQEPQKKKMKITDGDGHEMNGAPVYGFIRGTVPCNDQLAELMDDVRPLLREAVESVNKLSFYIVYKYLLAIFCIRPQKVKMWITFLIPRIEDGNNFGVGIQEEALGEVRNVESEAASFLDQMSRYFTSRAKLLTKVAKYPHVSDYRRAILDMDEKQFINIRLVILEVRNHYSTLHDLITKNMEKIKKPRSSNMDVMY